MANKFFHTKWSVPAPVPGDILSALGMYYPGIFEPPGAVPGVPVPLDDLPGWTKQPGGFPGKGVVKDGALGNGVGTPSHGSHRYWRVAIGQPYSGAQNIGLSDIEFRATVGGSALPGTITASSQYDSTTHKTANLYDGDETGTYWASLNAPAWILMDLGEGVSSPLAEVAMIPRPTTLEQSPRQFAVQYSDTGDEHDFHTALATDLGTTNTWVALTRRTFAVPSAPVKSKGKPHGTLYTLDALESPEIRAEATLIDVATMQGAVAPLAVDSNNFIGTFYTPPPSTTGLVAFVDATGSEGNGSFVDAATGKIVTTVGDANTTFAKKINGRPVIDVNASDGGTNDYLTLPVHNDFLFGTGDFTIDLWFNVTSLDTSWFRALIGNYLSGTASAGSWNLWLTATGNGMRFLFAGGTAASLTGNVKATVGKDTHVRVSRSAGMTRLFVDGAFVGKLLQNTNIGHNSTVAIGGNLATANDRTRGYLSRVMLYKGVALSDDDEDFVPPMGSFTGGLAVESVLDGVRTFLGYTDVAMSPGDKFGGLIVGSAYYATKNGDVVAGPYPVPSVLKTNKTPGVVVRGPETDAWMDDFEVSSGELPEGAELAIPSFLGSNIWTNTPSTFNMSSLQDSAGAAPTLEEDDLIVLIHNTQGFGNPSSAPAGYSTASRDLWGINVYYKFMDASPDASIAIPDVSGTSWDVGAVFAFRGINRDAPLNSVSRVSSDVSAIMNAPAVTPSMPRSLVLVVGGHGNNTATLTRPAELSSGVNHYRFYAMAATVDPSIAVGFAVVGDTEPPAVFDPGPFTAVSSSGWGAMTLVFRPKFIE
jgi:hypothetical protein